MPRDIQVKVIARAKRNFVKEESGGLKVYTTSPALEGRANEAVVEALADFLGVRKSQVAIIRGFKSRVKVLRIQD